MGSFHTDFGDDVADCEVSQYNVFAVIVKGLLWNASLWINVYEGE